MYLPLLDAGEPFSPFVYIRDAMHALVLYLFAFFTSSCGLQLVRNVSQNVGVPAAKDGQYLIGVGIGDVTGYAPSTVLMVPCLIPTTSKQPSRRDEHDGTCPET